MNSEPALSPVKREEALRSRVVHEVQRRGQVVNTIKDHHADPYRWPSEVRLGSSLFGKELLLSKASRRTNRASI
jgi:hypothetical protein